MTDKTIKPILKDNNHKEENVDLSPEDQVLKEQLEQLLVSLYDSSVELSTKALSMIKEALRESTSSITAIPKPLKFLNVHRETITEFYQSQGDTPLKKNIAELLSVLYICEPAAERKSLQFLVQNNLCLSKAVTEWGMEQLRLLTSQITLDIQERVLHNESFDDLVTLSVNIAEYQNKEHLFFEAVDILYEINKLENLVDFTTHENHRKICDQLLQCNKQSSDWTESEEILTVIGKIQRKHGDRINLLRIWIKLNLRDEIKTLLKELQEDTSEDAQIELIQCCFILARNNYAQIFETEDEKLTNILHNKQILEYYFLLAKNLDVSDVKSPKQIYKKHLEETRVNDKMPESAYDNLADTFVNAFVNLAFQKDSLFSENDEWVFKNKERNKMLAVGSIGLIYLWDTEKSMEVLDKQQQVDTDIFVQAGQQLGLGLSASATGNLVDSDLVLEIIKDKLESNPHETIVLSILIGLTLAYSGSCRQDVADIFQNQIFNYKLNSETMSVCILGLGILFSGSCNLDIATLILTQILETEEQDKNFFQVSLSLGIICLGQQSKAESIQDIIRSLEHESQRAFTLTLIESLAWTSSGNIMIIQKNLNRIHAICKQHEEKKQETKLEELGKKTEKDKDKNNSMHDVEQTPETKNKVSFEDYEIQTCVLGMTLVCFGESISSDLILRSQDHIIQQGNDKSKQALPLSIALLHLSNPKFTIIDVLSRSLAEQQGREQKMLHAVRISQGMLHAGKGLVSISPLNSNKLITNIPALSGIITMLFSCLNVEETILGIQNYYLFYLTPSIKPRWLLTLDKECTPVKLQMKIGNEVDIVGIQGNPKAVTGFQIHETPLILGYNDKAEIVHQIFEKEGWDVMQNQILEDIVVVRKKKQ